MSGFCPRRASHRPERQRPDGSSAIFWADPTSTFNYQWVTFGLTDLVLLVLIRLERHNRAGRLVFPAMLAVFVLVQAPALLGLTDGPVAGFRALVRFALAGDGPTENPGEGGTAE